MCQNCTDRTPDSPQDVAVRLTYRDGRTVVEQHGDWNAWRLRITFNRTAFDAHVTDVFAERVTGEE